jgi:hypothetical protein
MGAPNVMNPKRGRTVSCHGSGPEVRDGHFRVACSELSTVDATIAPGLLEAYGNERWPRHFAFEVANCNLKAANSGGEGEH